MKYVSVTSPGSEMSKPIFNYFDDYLVSLGEPTTSSAWTLMSVLKHAKKLIKEKPDSSRLYIDSGGFQIIVGHIAFKRVKEFIFAYHEVLEMFRNDIDAIFALDVFNVKFLKDPNTAYNKDNIIELYNINKFSMQESIKMIQKYPEIADKQLFILQSGNVTTFNIWKDLFTDVEVYKHYKRWSIGGLVGLKKATNAKFSHAVPATLWLLTYQKKYDITIDQIHWLGQSSRLSFLSLALFEKLFGLNMTSDSSQLVRFAPLDAKLPYLSFQDDKYALIENKADVISKMLPRHSIDDPKCYIRKNHTNGKTVEVKVEDAKKNPNVKTFEESAYEADDGKSKNYYQTTPEQYLEYTGKLDNQTFIELQSQNLFADLNFGNLIADIIVEKGLDYFTDVQSLKDLHPVMNRGRIAKEMFNNLQYFKKFEPIIVSADTDAADAIMQEIVESYSKD